jgi:drug/metabolite transporter superfamily protein YnfA
MKPQQAAAMPDIFPTTLARRLGYAGLVPFALLAIAVWLLDPEGRHFVARALAAYGATVVSFVGALHWGLVMREPAPVSAGSLGWGVLPSLGAWVALLLPADLGLWMLAALLWLCFAVDRKTYPRLGVAGWLPMRLHLTAVASSACAFAALRFAV